MDRRDYGSEQDENFAQDGGYKNNPHPDLLEGMEYSPYMDLFFPFIIHEEHRLSEQAIVLAGLSV